MLALAVALVLAPTASVQRDAFGIPHVQADSAAEAFELAGYAVAQDRIKQMDLSRRSARGRLSEVLGQRGVASDKDALRFGYTDAEYDQMVAALPTLTRTALQAYAAGVNRLITERKLDIPPWTPTDSAAIGVNLVRRFGRGGAGEIRNLLLFTYLKERNAETVKAVFDDLLWQVDGGSRPTLAAAIDPQDRNPPFSPTVPGAWERHTSMLPRVNMFELLPAIRIEQQQEMVDLAAELGIPSKFGSYAIVENGSRAQRPFLLNGPQMGFSSPSIVHQMSIDCPQYKAIGMDLPGLPGIMVGRTDRSAWGVTSGVADTDDIFFVALDPENANRYRYKGEWKTFEKHDFEIRPNDGEPQTVSREMSVLGPVVIKSTGTGVAYVRRSTVWKNEMKAVSSIIEEVAGGSINFKRLADNAPASFNLFGLDSRISWHYTGDIPVRNNTIDPRLPAPGNGDYDWSGILPKINMPAVTNPAGGLIVNWNNKPTRWWPNFDTPVWGRVFRIDAIYHRIAARRAMAQTDVMDLLREIAIEDTDATDLLQEIRRDLPLSEAGTLGKAAELLRDWNRLREDQTVAPLIWSQFYDSLRKELFEPALGPLLNPTVFFTATQATVTVKALRGETFVNYLAGRDRKELIKSALSSAVEVLSDRHGEDMTKWRYQADTIRWTGAPSITHTNRGTYIQYIERWGDSLRGVFIAPPGASEDPASPHFVDQVGRAASWSLLPMDFPKNSQNRSW